MTNRKQKIDWLFNQPNAIKAINAIGAKNLTLIKSVVIEDGKEIVISTYSKMVEYDSNKANIHCIIWMREEISKYGSENNESPNYIYFRFKRY